jgi:hypothetical protein
MSRAGVSGRHRNSDGLVLFPGTDLKRNLELKGFLRRPIDSRMPLLVPPPPPSHPSYSIRASGPSEEVKREWDFRLEGVRARTRLQFRRPISTGVPEISKRELSKLPTVYNTHHLTPVEAICDELKSRVQGAAFAPPSLPRLRRIPADLANARTRERSRLY